MDYSLWLTWEVLQSVCASSTLSGTFFLAVLPYGYNLLRRFAKQGLVGLKHQISDLKPHATFWNFDILFIKERKNELVEE